MIDKFKAKFVEEAFDNVHDLEEALLLLESDRSDKEIIERIFRAMHSLKGGGAMFGFNDLSAFTHHLEAIYDAVRTNKLELTTDIINLTFEAIDHIKSLIEIGDVEGGNNLEHNAFVEKIKLFLTHPGSSEEIKVQKPIAPSVQEDSRTYLITFKPHDEIFNNGTNPLYLLDDVAALGETIVLPNISRIPSLKNLNPLICYVSWQIFLNTKSDLNEIKDVFIFVEDECTLEIKEVAHGNILNGQEFKDLVDQLYESGKDIELNDIPHQEVKITHLEASLGVEKKKVTVKEHKISSIRVASKKVDDLVTLVSELVTIQAQLNLYAEKSGQNELLSISESIQKLSRQLRDNALEISLIPIQSELMRFQRLVRDLSKDLNKEIDFIIEGSDIELDKNIIEHLTDPLLHMLRNSVDHGIESAEERIKKGKSPKGTIIFKAFYSGPSVIIKISDDGKGIDPEFIRKKAIEKKLIDAGIELTKKEILDLVFLSGFSTRDAVSDVSGRGVGMDVVKNKIAEIRGEVSIDSELHIGTTITLELPLTLSIIDGLLVTVAENNYVFPISIIEKIHAINVSLLSTVFNSTVVVDNTQYPIINLREVLNEPDNYPSVLQMVLVKNEDKRYGVLVDQVIGEYQTVVKPLGTILKKQEIISGATILGDGSIAFVVDSHRLIHNFIMKRYSKV